MDQGRVNMVTIGGNASGHKRLSERRQRPRLVATLVEGLATAAMVLATTSGALAGSKPGLATTVAVSNAGGGIALAPATTGASIETFAPGTRGNEGPKTLNTGSATDLNNSTDVKFDPTGLFLAVSNSAAAAAFAQGVLLFASTATSNTGPVTAITVATDPQIDYPDGVAWEADGHLWAANLLPAFCLETPLKDCAATSADFCGFGSIQEFETPELGAPVNPTPVRTINPCGLVNAAVGLGDGTVAAELVGPRGMVADQTSVEVCVPSAAPPSGNPCFAVGGIPVVPPPGFSNPVTTDRLWVVDNLAGLVTIYEPELVDTLVAEFGTPAGNGLITGDGTSQAPIGGAFSTLVVGTEAATSPQYIALGELEEAAYITDADGGFATGKGAHAVQRGQISEFGTETVPATCAIPFLTGGAPTPPNFSEGCSVIVLGATVLAEAESVIGGKKTGLNGPAGIAAIPSLDDEDDTILVANSVGWTIEQFAPGAEGNVGAEVVVNGPGGYKGKTKLFNPVGLGIPFQSE
jgi:hypothetical protein